MKAIVYWEWEEAFDIFGFGDGGGPNFTDVIRDFLTDLGWVARTQILGWHNERIYYLEGPNGEKPMDEHERGYDCPREYLPIELIQALDREFPEEREGLKTYEVRFNSDTYRSQDVICIVDTPDKKTAERKARKMLKADIDVSPEWLEDAGMVHIEELL
tara:strand:+ start:513 stop:989 length:477 start_codon:yes stop_codon:yes gene_type:complete